jgi:hypothetical protein
MRKTSAARSKLSMIAAPPGAMPLPSRLRRYVVGLARISHRYDFLRVAFDCRCVWGAPQHLRTRFAAGLENREF